MIIRQLTILAVLFLCVVFEKTMGDDLFWREVILLVAFWVGVRKGKFDNDVMSKICAKAFAEFIYNYDRFKKGAER